MTVTGGLLDLLVCWICKVAELYNCTVIKFYSDTVIDMYICRVVQVCSILDLLGVTGTRSLDAVQLGFKQLYKCTAVQLYSCTIVQLGVAVNGSPSTVQLIFEQLNDYKVVQSDHLTVLPLRFTLWLYTSVSCNSFSCFVILLCGCMVVQCTYICSLDKLRNCTVVQLSSYTFSGHRFYFTSGSILGEIENVNFDELSQQASPYNTCCLAGSQCCPDLSVCCCRTLVETPVCRFLEETPVSRILV